MDNVEVDFYQINVNPSSSGQQFYPVIQIVDSDDGFVDSRDSNEGEEDSASCSTEKGRFPERITCAQTSIEREFLHIVIKAAPDLYDCSEPSSGETMVFCSTHDGPFATKWTVHFYPLGHPSGSATMVPHLTGEQKYASLYVRLQESATDMMEARITASVVNGPDKAESVVKSSMDKLMLCPRNKIDQFQRGTSGHGWPKISSIKDLKNYKKGFCLVVTLQIVKPENAFNSSCQSKVFRSRAVQHRKNHPGYLLQRNGMYCDAFLQAKDWQWVPAHRFILAGGSTLFRRLLEEDQGVPFVFKTENTVEELNVLLDILYQGKIPARTLDQSMKLREMIYPYGVEFAQPVFLNDFDKYHQLTGETVDNFATSSQETLDL